VQELKVPSVGESIVEVEIGAWLKKEGEAFGADEPLVELITDKATLELPAPFAGTLKKILKARGETARVGEAIALLEEGKAEAQVQAPTQAPEEASPEPLAMPAAERLMREAGVSPRRWWAPAWAAASSRRTWSATWRRGKPLPCPSLRRPLPLRPPPTSPGGWTRSCP